LPPSVLSTLLEENASETQNSQLLLEL